MKTIKESCTRRKYWLREGTDAIEDATLYRTKKDAVNAYKWAAQELAEYGQELEATIHVADCRENIAEYPDYVLYLGPRGGVNVEKA